MLKIAFDNPQGEIHIVLTDGCSFLLNPDDLRLSEEQIACARQEGLRRFLLYENIGAFELFNNGKIRVYCPRCNTEYHLKREDYEPLLKEFCNEGKHDYWNGLIKSRN